MLSYRRASRVAWGAALRTTVVPAARASPAASMTVDSGISSCMRSTCAAVIAARSDAPSPTSSAFAPGSTTMTFSPAASTITTARPVRPCVVRTRASMPSAARTRSSSAPSGSVPTAPTNRVRAPARAAATAWFRPLPPGPLTRVAPSTVSPAPGSSATRRAMSRFALPSTVTPDRLGIPARYGLRTGGCRTPRDAPSLAGQLRAEPATQVSHGTFQTPPRPFHDSVARPVPLVTIGSPSLT